MKVISQRRVSFLYIVFSSLVLVLYGVISVILFCTFPTNNTLILENVKRLVLLESCFFLIVFFGNTAITRVVSKSIEINARFLLDCYPQKMSEVESCFFSSTITESEYTMRKEKITNDINTVCTLDGEAIYIKKCIAISGMITIFLCFILLLLDFKKEFITVADTISKIVFTGTLVQLIYFITVMQIKRRLRNVLEPT